jgi:hypothetical protein
VSPAPLSKTSAFTYEWDLDGDGNVSIFDYNKEITNFTNDIVVAPQTEVTPQPKITPSPEVTPQPKITSSPEVTPQPKITPSPEVTPQHPIYILSDIQNFLRKF